MKTVHHELLNETYYHYILPNGLKVFLNPRPDFHRTYGIMATKYGSLDLEFIPSGETEYVKTPAGIAHFLEHKLFEDETGVDATNLFSQIGADVNAFTSYDRTAYLFSTTSQIEDAVNLLLDMVQTPYFEAESIKREQGIIEQELLMYLDQPSMALQMGTLESIYRRNAVRKEIGGTVSSIKKIDAPILNMCYKTFYHPSNMIFVLAGRFDVEEIAQVIENNQAAKNFSIAPSIKRKYHIEGEKVFKHHQSQLTDVIIPKASVGLKFDCRDETPEEILKNGLMLDIILDICFDNASDNRRYLLEKGLIDNSFEYESYYEKTFAHLMIQSDTARVEDFFATITEQLLQIPEIEITEDTFNRYKKINQALTLKRFNSIEYVANLFIEAEFNELELFDMIDTINRISLDEINEFKKRFKKESITTFFLYPKDNSNMIN